MFILMPIIGAPLAVITALLGVFQMIVGGIPGLLLGMGLLVLAF